MEYLEGVDLGRHLKSGAQLTIHEAIDLTVQAAEALAQAHAAGVIHRDVKPANLFMSRGADGVPVVKMLDFGIAKVVEETAQNNLELTKTRAVMGSALYMSLEQMRSTKTVDYRTDIYSLGITLYELLTHTHPFMAESFSELCVKVSLDPPDPISRHRPDITDELAEVIAQAYARYPDDRYPTVAAFAAALAPFAAEETQAMIAAIQRIERAASGERPMVRMLTPLTNKALIELNKASTLPPRRLRPSPGPSTRARSSSPAWPSPPSAGASRSATTTTSTTSTAVSTRVLSSSTWSRRARSRCWRRRPRRPRRSRRLSPAPRACRSSPALRRAPR